MDPDNVIFLGDSYKISHHKQYPPGTTYIKSYFESRGGKHPATVFFGLQYILKKYLTRRVTKEMVDEAEEVLRAHFGRDDVFNREGWSYIAGELGGRLPVRVRAVPEGSVVPVRNVLFVVESTDERVPWVANFVETCLVQAWYPMTVATGSLAQRRALEEFAARTGGDVDAAKTRLHDFGYRGCSSQETAGLGGAAHLAVFRGTDTLAALAVAKNYYGPADLMPGTSIPATEHSTTTSWGKSGELASVRHMLAAFPTGAVSAVADSYDVWNFLDGHLGTDLRSAVEGRDGCLVVRPDSGDPTEMVLKVLAKLESNFGYSKNAAGFKLLPPYLRVLQGDGVCYETIVKVLEAMAGAGWCSDNVTFGSGGALLQKMDRDTQKCAYKCCLAVVGGERVDVFKDPVTDPGKASKKGDVTLVKEAGQYKTVRREDLTESMEDQLVTVFENGEVVKEYDFPSIRERVDQSLRAGTTK